jgi:hypothetical protein
LGTCLILGVNVIPPDGAEPGVARGEDRLHARKTAQVLAWARNLAMSLLRHYRFKYIPDDWRFACAHPQAVLGWLTSLTQN